MAAMRSVRHVPLYAVVAAPVIASECASWWASWSQRSSPGSVARVFWDSDRKSAAPAAWVLVGCCPGALALWLALPQSRIADFPAAHFPVAAVSRNLGAPDGPARVLTSDQWPTT